ncbi:hypothetical protein K3727_16865 [Rhodobacteraceae bacterium M382]|nr:hypothetical protein K3727_16865 [Rhodobacteraceae bacterium M382]
MGLPPKAYYSIHEAAGRWDCSLSDIAGWASVGRFDIVTGISPAVCGSRTIAGFVAVSVSDILPLFSCTNAGLNSRRLKRIRVLGEQDWQTVTKPAKGISITLGDLMILAEEARRFEEDCDLLRRPAEHIGSTPNYDWDGMYLTLVLRVHEQGVPPTQAEWVGEVQEWFVKTSQTGKVPDERTIRRRITPIWKALRDPCC